jgi:hypothetical protein
MTRYCEYINCGKEIKPRQKETCKMYRGKTPVWFCNYRCNMSHIRWIFENAGK